MPNSFLDNALYYATEKNWPVFPIKPRGKTPLTARGFKDASRDPATIRAWWTRWPDANIGLPTGEDSGVVVVDIDCKDGKVGEASFSALTAEHGEPPQTATSLTSQGGRHLFFTCPDPVIKNTTGTLGQDIDTRGDGGYVVLPPSVHPTGEAYRWADASPAAPAELPGWLRPAERKPSPAKTRMVAALPGSLNDRMKRAEAYIDAMPPSIDGQGGHNAAFAVATVLAHGFDLPDHIARNLFVTRFNPRCQPPWSDKEIDHKIKQARTTAHDSPLGWLLDQEPPTDPQAEANAARILQFARAKAAPVVTVAEPAKSTTFPPHLLKPPGYLGELTHWINSTAFKPQPALALANSLAFMGALLGRRVRTSSDLRSNLYCLGIGESGCGKDHSRKAIKRLCAEAGITGDLLGGEELSSDSSILTAVARNPAVLFQIDEIGHLFLTTNSKNASSYQRNIPVMLTKLYSSASTLYLGKEYADAEATRRDIDQPCVCIYGTTVPGRLYEGITTNEIRDGFLGRNLVFQSEDADPDPVDMDPAPMPRSLVEMAQAWFSRDTSSSDQGNIERMTKAQQIVVGEQDDAKRVFLAFRKQARAERAKAVHLGGGLDSLWSRAEENARKVAMIVACGVEFGGPVVGRDVAEYACELVAHLVRSLVTAIEHHVSDTEFGRKRLEVLNAIRSKARPITKTQLARLTRGLRGKDRDEILAELLLSGEIVKSEEPVKGGRPATVFAIAPDFLTDEAAQ